MIRYLRETDGKLHWVPLTITVFGLYVNVGLLETNGLEIPTTLTGWETICRFFADKGVLPSDAGHGRSGVGSAHSGIGHQAGPTWRRFRLRR